jgi:hypothetical protein
MDSEISKADAGLKGTLKKLNQLIDKTKGTAHSMFQQVNLFQTAHNGVS